MYNDGGIEITGFISDHTPPPPSDQTMYLVIFLWIDKLSSELSLGQPMWDSAHVSFYQVNSATDNVTQHIMSKSLPICRLPSGNRCSTEKRAKSYLGAGGGGDKKVW